MFRPLFTLLRVALVSVAMTSMVGCGGGAKPKQTDPAKAKIALQATLDAWKNGDAYDAPTKKTPPTYVSDSDWQGGKQLLEYAIEDERSAGFGWRIQVSLKLKATDGATHQRRAMYRIDTEPAVVVVREE